MKAIILAAGRGSRMGKATAVLPKCRSVLQGKELIQWQFESILGAGIAEIAIVRGYLAETFKFKVKYFDNLKWSETNIVSSLQEAHSWLENDICIVSYSDIVYSQNAVKKLICANEDIVIAYDPNWHQLWEKRFVNVLTDAESFKLVSGKVVKIGGKVDFIEEIEGQYMGLLKITPIGWGKITSYFDSLPQKLIDKMDITMLLQRLINIGVEINAVPIDDQWFEVDSVADLVIYEKTFSKIGSMINDQ